MNKIFSDQDDWDQLLDFISEKNLTVVLGKEMYKYRDNDKLIILDDYLKQKILEKFSITDFTPASLMEALNYLKVEKNILPIDINDALKSILKKINADFPLLARLISIKQQNYYINTTVYNHFLEDKIKGVHSVNFTISESFSDCPDLEKLTEPFVFNVFGSLFKTVDPALSEEDMLEFASNFKDKIAGATNIISALKSKNLLFLGCSFPEWLIRFVLRFLSNEALHDWGSKRRIIIVNDPSEYRDKKYQFLKNYRVTTYEGSTDDFVQELSNQWNKRFPTTVADNPVTEKNKMVFLSYTRDDTTAVENLKKSIEQIGNITCWYDKRELAPGDNWVEKIVYNIRQADIFMPLISNNSIEHKDGYVQDEWKQGSIESTYRKAIKRDGNYLVPVVIDESPQFSDAIAAYFDRNINVAKVPQGNPDGEFINGIKKILNMV